MTLFVHAGISVPDVQVLETMEEIKNLESLLPVIKAKVINFNLLRLCFLSNSEK